MINFDENAITHRVLLASKHIGLNDTELAKSIGVKKQMINQLRNNHVTLPAKRAIIFLDVYREIDVKWLLFGEGEIIAQANQEGRSEFIIKENGDMRFVSEKTKDENYKEKYEKLKTAFKEKEQQILFLEKALENQTNLLNKLIDKME